MSESNETRARTPEPATTSHRPGPGTAPIPTDDPPAAVGTRAQTPDEAAASALGSAPDAIAGYALAGELGEGGMGVVYRARQLSLSRDVAIKLLKRRYAADSAAARRFLDEARITGQLQHPAIPPVHDIGTLPDGRPYLAMKLIKGETLAELLDGAPADRGRFVAAFARVCQAVAFAHARKVIHRDLKPGNVMVGAFGEVQVMDWGLAKVLAEGDREPSEGEVLKEATEINTAREPEAATQTGSVLGTPAYMAPEQAGGEIDKVDERADVFGLGAVLCTILTGKPPYSGPTPDAIRLMAIRGETADAFARLDACDADPELVILCKGCLARERESRPRDAGAVAKAVEAYLAAAEERSRQAELDRVRAQEQRKRRRVQSSLSVAVLLLIALAAVGGALTKLWREAEGARAQLGYTNDGLVEANRRAAAARDDALRQKGIADAARRKLEVFEYGRTIQMAHQEWRDNNILGARALLEGTEHHLRGWEWRYVHRLCHSDRVTLKGHTGGVSSASFSPDGLHIVTGSDDTTAKVWDVATGAEAATLRGHTSEVYSASFSRDGTLIVTASDDKTAKIWDAKTGTEVRALEGHTGGVRSASFAPDGSRIVTGSSDGTAKVWDAKTGAEVFTLKGHTGGVSSASFSPNGSHVVTSSWDGTARVWEVPSTKPEGVAKTGAHLRTLGGHAGGVSSASFSPNGLRIVTGSLDRTARVWDAKTGTEVRALKSHTASVLSASFSPDGSRIVTGSWDETARVWDAETGAEVLVLKGHAGDVNVASFGPGGSRVVTGSADKTARVWDVKTGAEVLAVKGHSERLSSASFSPNGSRVVTASDDKTAKVWEVPSAKPEGFAKTGAEVLTLTGHTGGVSSASFDPAGLRVVTASSDGTAKVWDAQTGTEILILKGHIDGVSSASFSRDGSRVVTGSSDGTAKVWDAKTGAEVFTLRGHTGGVSSASFDRDGLRIVTASSDATAKVWDARTGTEVLALKGHAASVLSASFSPNGLRVVTGSWDGTAKVWEVPSAKPEGFAKTGAEVLTLTGHARGVYSASFSPDGSRVVTGGYDRTAKMWDVEIGAEVLTLKGHTGSVLSASFSPDGSRVVTASADNTARVWDATPLNREFLPRELAPPPRPVGK